MLPVTARRLHLPELAALVEAPNDGARIAILTDALKSLMAQIEASERRSAFALNSAGGERTGFRIAVADTFIASTDRTVGMDATAATRSMYLPLTSEYPGLTVCVYRSAGANVVTLFPRGTDTVSGAASIAVTVAAWYQADSINGNWVAL